LIYLQQKFNKTNYIYTDKNYDLSQIIKKDFKDQEQKYKLETSEHLLVIKKNKKKINHFSIKIFKLHNILYKIVKKLIKERSLKFNYMPEKNHRIIRIIMISIFMLN